jgi:hypothetical protein
MNTRLVLLLLAESCLAFGCHSPSNASASASSQVPQDPCDQLRGDFQTLLGAATTHCSKDDDCTCGPGGIEPAGCGRIMNRESAEKLFRAYTRFHRQCDLDLHCAPETCRAACENARCVQRFDSTEVHPVLRPPK